MAKRYRRTPKKRCSICYENLVLRTGDACLECRRWMARYRGVALYGHDRLLVREIHALRQRVARGLPLFVHGRLAVREGD